MSKFVAVLAWLSFFGLAWGVLLSEKLQNAQSITALCLFLIMAIASTSMSTKKEEPKK